MSFNLAKIRGVDLYSKCVLTVIAILLGIVAFKPYAHPPAALAASDYSYLYVEPRTYTLRKPNGMEQVEGKVVIDMRNGDIWGFPTVSALPYPVDPSRSEPPISTPMYLGKFDFSKVAPK
jgi:hypothetical protein